VRRHTALLLLLKAIKKSNEKVALSRVTNSTGTIAARVPNQSDIDSDWKTYRVSVDYVELLTGCDFFSNVTDSL
jgi:endonuclease G